MNVVERMRFLARENPFLYRVWFIYYRRKKNFKPSIPQRNDDLFITGFPRSGNTYFAEGIRSLFPDVSFASHLHTIAPVRLAISSSVPTFVLIRNPMDALLSYGQYAMSDRNVTSKRELSGKPLIELLVEEWRRYHSHIWTLRKSLHTIRSEAAFAEPFVEFKRIADIAGLSLGKDFQARWEEFDERFKVHDATKPQGSTSAPDKARSRARERLRREFENNECLSACRILYQRLIEES